MRGFEVDGDVLLKLRREAGLTQERLADLCGCDVKTVRKAERSGRLDAALVDRLAAAFGVESRALLESRSRRNVGLFWRWQEAFNARDADALTACFAEEATLETVVPKAVPGAGRFTGRAAIAGWAGHVFAAMRTEPITPEMVELDAFDDFVLARPRRPIAVTAVETGRTERAWAVHEFRVRDGLIVGYRIFPDTAALLRVHGAALEGEGG